MDFLTNHPSPIQTFTVGFGFAPNPARKELAGLEALLHHRRLGISPDPEGYKEYSVYFYLTITFI